MLRNNYKEVSKTMYQKYFLDKYFVKKGFFINIMSISWTFFWQYYDFHYSVTANSKIYILQIYCWIKIASLLPLIEIK